MIDGQLDFHFCCLKTLYCQCNIFGFVSVSVDCLYDSLSAVVGSTHFLLLCGIKRIRKILQQK